MGTPPEPSETELARWMKTRLARMGASFLDPEILEEALVEHRDLWLKLYEIDREFGHGAVDHANPS